ncbi:S-layer homology domain-containing protein [Paenibacillus alba]|uniref:S-layer homology domain-containing protein n=1 Tax=Paenibacillus alba TaxID=1197127 RepID=UPI0015647AA4|nr:S-layer homology domain-containing protein [Paenibacillus alba]NQX71910.1 S-layer homology domain-containing protein [Paenibacillus alba]
MSKSSSNIVTKRQKNKPKDFQGGEIKVMKKSLSVILSSAMALSMFSSMAFADTEATTTTTVAAKKTSADFTDLKDLDAATKAKFDAMISAGIFDGTSDTTFGLKEEMNRAQFAKVAALIMGVEINKDLKTSSFSDVKSDDAANGYALPYIEALKTAGVTDGYAEGQYNPAGKVTKEQLATFLVRVLGKDADAKAKTGNDSTVTDWAQGYVALALELKLLPTGDGGKFGGQANATRDLLLTGAYEAKQQYVSPGKVSVTEAKATGAQKVTVTFNKPVDTDKAKIALKKGTSDVVTTTKFADDKKSAVLTLTDVKVSNGEYTVNVTGLDAANTDKTTASFTGQDEVLQKIDFVTAGDTIAYSNKVIIKAKAVNQYGEAATTNAGSYNVYTSGASFIKITKDTEGTLLITLDTVNGNSTTQGVSIIPVTIVNNDSHITATKNFKLGTQPILTKLELGNARYSVGEQLSGKGENVKFDINLFDQYGGNISYDSLINEKTATSSATRLYSDPTLIWTNYIDSKDVTYEIEDNGNDLPEVKISLLNDIDKSGDYNFTIFSQAATATGKITVKSAKVANKIQIGEINDVIAAGDTDLYVPVVAYDASGNQLSVEDLTSDQNVDRIKISISGAVGSDTTNPSTGKIEQAGEHKGSIRLTTINSNAKGAVSITAVIATANATSTATKTYTVSDARVPDHFKEVTAPAKQAVAGGNTKFKYNVIDQYGAVLDKALDVDTTTGNVSTGGSHYTVEVTAVTTNPSATDNKYANTNAWVTLNDEVPFANQGMVVTADNKLTAVVKATDPTVTGANPNAVVLTGSDLKKFNDFARIRTSLDATNQKVDYTARIVKTTGGTSTEVAKITKTLTIASADSDLTYTLNTIHNMFNLLDSGVVTDSVYAPGQTLTKDDQIKDPSKDDTLWQEVTVSAKNAAGETVKLPKKITNISTSNPSVAQVKLVGGVAYVIGNKTGTATISVSFSTVKGEIKQATMPITVKDDALAVASIKNETDEVQVQTGANAFAAMDLDVYDNYGGEYEDAVVGKYNYLLGFTFSVSHVKGGKASVDQYGTIIAETPGTTFDLTITAPNGKSASTPIKIVAAN